MRRKGYQLTRFADDWVITCKSAAEARAALAAATRILGQLGVRLNPQKTRIVHIQQGFDFLGYRIVRTSGKSKIPRGMIQRWNKRTDRISLTKIDLSFPGSGADVDATQCPAKDSGADTGTKSDLARLGRVLQTSPRSNALPQTRRLDRAAHLVAPFPPVADPGLASVAQGEAV